MISRHTTTESAEYDQDGAAVTARFLRMARRYMTPILLSLAAVTAFYVIAASVVYLVAPSQAITSLPFRINFTGAEQHTYPNGTRFVTSDIVAASVLAQVHRQNGLERFVSLEEFSDSVFVVESNQALDALSREYEAKLSDPKLNAVDRERLQEEYQQKRASLSKSQFSINYVETNKLKSIPRSLVNKSLNDILKGWAEQISGDRGALRYQIPIVGDNVIPRDFLLQQDPAVALDMLRSKIQYISRDLGRLQAVPGAEVLRTSKENIGLQEIRLNLDDILRVQIRPLILRVKSKSLVTDREDSIEFFETQIDHNRLKYNEARARLDALTQSLTMYSSGVRPEAGLPDSRPQLQSTVTADTVAPQLSETFLEKLVELSGEKEDREYRQRAVDEIRETYLSLVPHQMEIEYYTALINELRQSSGSRDWEQAELATVKTRLQQAMDGVINSVRQMNEIYRLLSMNLNTSSSLYTVTAPASREIERSITGTRLALVGLVLILISIPIALVAAAVHARMSEEDSGDSD